MTDPKPTPAEQNSSVSADKNTSIPIHPSKKAEIVIMGDENKDKDD